MKTRDDKSIEWWLYPMKQVDKMYTIKEMEIMFGLGAANHATGIPSFEDALNGLDNINNQMESVDKTYTRDEMITNAYKLAEYIRNEDVGFDHFIVKEWFEQHVK